MIWLGETTLRGDTGDVSGITSGQTTHGVGAGDYSVGGYIVYMGPIWFFDLL